jgi:hypothetical protein
MIAIVQPSWGQATFKVSVIAFAVACAIVLGINVYVLAINLKDTLKERNMKKEVK